MLHQFLRISGIYGLIVISQIFILKELTLNDTKLMLVSHKIQCKC